MTSQKIDILEKLKQEEIILKNKQLVLSQEIELELEKNRRLEKDGSIIKLRTQLDELLKIIDTPVIQNNYKAVLYDKETTYQNNLNEWHKNNQIGKTDDKKQNELGNMVNELNILREKESIRLQQLSIKQNVKINSPNPNSINDIKDFISIKDYMKNLSKINPSTIDQITNAGVNSKIKQCLGERGIFKSQVSADFKEKVYYDILPLFTTIIGIMEKQQEKIDELNNILNN
jgi:rRNA maturation endonuclease Nob1